MIYGYIRVSTSDQASGDKTSLAEQERKIRGFASMPMDDPEVRIFSDPGVSGSVPLDERPDGIKMLAALKEGDCICASKLDRLFRSATDALQSVEALHKRGVEVVLLDVSVEPIASSGVGKLFFSILASVAEFERWRIAERMADGRHGKKTKGGFIGGHAPYGKKIVGKGTHAILVENVTEQKVIQFVAAQRSESGRSLNQIIQELDRRGIANRQGKRFMPEQIRRIVKTAAVQEAAE